MRAISIVHKKYTWMDTHKEISDLILAAGYREVGSIIFKKVHDINYLPELKLEELKQQITEGNIDVVIFNEPLKVKQLQKLYGLTSDLNIQILDKVMLILDIFSKKSNSKNIQLQIKLAEFRYSYPRLKDVVAQNTYTEKQARDTGPGESLQHIMKTDYKAKIAQMTRELNEIGSAGKKRYSVPSVPIIGFYSVGKTTLFNIITESHRETSPQAFTTMFLKSTWSKILGFPIEVIDTIGIVDLPPGVIESFSVMFERIFSSQYIVICIDASVNREGIKDQLVGLDEYFQLFSDSDYSYSILFVFTKCDKISEDQYQERIQILKQNISRGIFPCDEYQIIKSRIDHPDDVKTQFIKKMGGLMKSNLYSFRLMRLTPSQLSKVHKYSNVNSEIWEGKFANVEGETPLLVFQEHLGDLIPQLSKESQENLEKINVALRSAHFKFINSEMDQVDW